MHRLNLPAAAAALSLLFFLSQPCLSSASGSDSCPSLSTADVHADVQSLRSQLSAARESVAELQSTVAALIGDLRQTHEFSARASPGPSSSWSSVLFSALSGAMAAREQLEATSTFLMEEAKELQSKGDDIVGNMWQKAGAAISLLLQTDAVLLFDVIAPVLQAFPDISQHTTLCTKAHAIILAYAGKTILIPLPNPLYSPKTAATQPRYKLHPLDLATDPFFNLIAPAVASCARSSEHMPVSACDTAKQVVADMAENGPFWLKAIVSSDRVASVTRLISHLCGQPIPSRTLALEQTMQQGEELAKGKSEQDQKTDSNNMA